MEIIHLLKLFFENRSGYIVDRAYNQLIYGCIGNKSGFTFQDFMSEIDQGRPVLIHFHNYTILGVGYNSFENQMIYGMVKTKNKLKSFCDEIKNLPSSY